MRRLSFVLCLWLACSIAAPFVKAEGTTAEVTAADVLGAAGSQQLSMLNDYLAIHAERDARQALALIKQIEPSLPLDLAAEATLQFLCYKAAALKLLGEHTQALAVVTLAIRAAKQQHNRPLLTKALLQRASIYTDQFQQNRAIEDTDAALLLFADSDQSEQYAVVLLGVSDIYTQLSRSKEAFKLALQALAIYELHQNEQERAVVNGRLGTFYREVGDLDQALAYELKALEAIKTFGDDKQLATAYNNTGIIYKDLAQYPQAIDMHQRSLALKQKIGYERGMVYSLNNLGETYRLQGDAKQARAYLTQAAKLASQLDNQLLLSSSYLYLGRLSMQEQDLPSARTYLANSIHISRERKNKARLAEALIELATLNNLQGKTELAVTQLQEALPLARVVQKNLVLFQAYERLSALLASQRQYEKAYLLLKTYQDERNQLFNLASQQRIEMQLVAQQVNETKTMLQLAKQEAELSKANVRDQRNQYNLALALLLFVSLGSWFLYFRQAQKKRLQLEIANRQAIEEKEQQLSLALWGSGDMLWDWDLRSGILARQNADKFGLLASSSITAEAATFGDYIHPTDLTGLMSALTDVINGQQQSFDCSYRVRNLTGQWLWVQDRGRVVERDNDGKAVRLAGIQHDINLLKQQEESLLHLNSELELRVSQRTIELEQTLHQLQATQTNLVEAEKMAALASIVSGLAHEINTPVGTAMTAVSHLNDQLHEINNLLQDGHLTKTGLEHQLHNAAESCTLIGTGIQKAAYLVEQFKRVAIPTRQDEMSSFGLQFVAHQALKSAQLLTAHHHGHQQTALRQPVQLVINQDMTLVSHFDPLFQVFEILLSNALEHANPSCSLQIQITGQESDDGYIIDFIDNGEGISAEHAERVFEPFFTTKRGQGHVGLGLNIAYNLVSQYFKGKIQCLVSATAGAHFVIYLPKPA